MINELTSATFHAWVHPRIAVRNARKLTTLNKREDIILKHMWGE